MRQAKRKPVGKKPTRGSSALWLQRRVEFMRQHPMLWDRPKKEIVNALKVAGLIAPTTYWMDVKVRRYIDLACVPTDCDPFREGVA
jgi:hypothetical protein